jgi:hypothetical protein
VLDEHTGVVHSTRSYTEEGLAGEAMHPKGEATVRGIDENHDGKFE